MSIINHLETAWVLKRGDRVLEAHAVFAAIRSGLTETEPMSSTCPGALDTWLDLCTLEGVERDHIRAVLRHTDGRLCGAKGAAKMLGL